MFACSMSFRPVVLSEWQHILCSSRFDSLPQCFCALETRSSAHSLSSDSTAHGRFCDSDDRAVDAAALAVLPQP